MNWVTKYARQINAGKIITSERVRKVYTRLAEDIKYSHAHKRSKYCFDEARAQHPIGFIEAFCNQSQGAFGAPIELDLFQKAFVSATFGFIERKTGLRRFREVLLLIARKNGKSTLLAALALYLIIADREGAAEVYAVATKREQAEIAFNQAVNMRRHSLEIATLTNKRRSDIYLPTTASFFKPLSSQSKSMDGLNVHAAIIDELHAIRNPELYQVIKDGTSGRRQPLIMMITTAGTHREGIYDQMYEYACKVADGEIEDERFLPVLYELDRMEEWTDPKCWSKANPGLGTIKQPEALQEAVERAKKIPAELSNLLCKHFNIRANTAASWLSYNDVMNDLTFTMEDVRNTYAVGGCDLSATTDLTAATLLIRKPNDPTIYVVQRYFIPEERVKIVEAEGSKEAPYRTWAERDLLTICEGHRVDYSAVTDWFCRMKSEYEITVYKVGYDTALSGYWVPEMERKGFFMETVRQGPFTFTYPMREMGAAFQDKIVNYNKNPMLAWCMLNTGVKKSGLNNIQPDKQSEKRRIDGMASLLDAWVVYARDYQIFMSSVER